MSLFCADGAIAEVTPWVPIPLNDRGKRIFPLELERDRCKLCGKFGWQHRTVQP